MEQLKIHLNTLSSRLRPFIHSSPDNDCQLWHGPIHTSTKQEIIYGRIRSKFPSDKKSKNYYVHRLIYMICNTIHPIPVDIVISHLCHHSLCVNIDHLSAEPQHVNNSRQNCNSEKRCTHHVFEGIKYADYIVSTKVRHAGLPTAHNFRFVRHYLLMPRPGCPGLLFRDR